VDDFPITAWRYHLDVPVHGADRQNLPDALEAEELDLFQDLPREEAYAAIRDGRLRYDAVRADPAPAFPQDLAVLSMYLFDVLRGIEVAERYVAEDVTDDVRAWKVVARRGEWVKVPLVVGRTSEGRSSWTRTAGPRGRARALAGLPTWFHDGMRPSTRRCERCSGRPRAGQRCRVVPRHARLAMPRGPVARGSAAAWSRGTRV
jgi:hypothetical protein